MNVPRGSLRTFLDGAKTSLHSAILNRQRVTLVIGNESADLDSITSAIVLAYLKSNASPAPLTNQSVNRHIPPSPYPSLYIPLLNVAQADIKIRPELLKLLPYANLEPRHLITLDDLSITAPAGLDPAGKENLQPSLTRLLLTDHNNLAGPLAKSFSNCVIGCIDHHIDEHTIPEDTGSEPRIITTKAGSCTSLVVQYCREAWDNLSTNTSSSASSSTSGQDDAIVGVEDAEMRRTWDSQVAKLALASVLIDTNSLQDTTKTEEVDQQAVKYLEAKIALAPGSVGSHWDRDRFFQEISEAKRNLDDLSLGDILRKDYKQWTVDGSELGISSVVKPILWQVEKAGGSSQFTDDINKFATQRDLRLFAIMTTSSSKDGRFQRELLLRPGDDKGEAVAREFAKRFGDDLGLEDWDEDSQLTGPSSGDRAIRIWWQRDVSKSRKQVGPILREAVEARGKTDHRI